MVNMKYSNLHEEHHMKNFSSHWIVLNCSHSAPPQLDNWDTYCINHENKSAKSGYEVTV